VVKCGATALVAGAAIFSSGESIEQAIKKLRQSLV
jgi:pentose-5-phosphate-3-epimerase